jgi:hypothetical protein
MVFSSLVQQILQRPISTQPNVEERNFLGEGRCLQVVAEIAAVQRVLECAHRISCRGEPGTRRHSTGPSLSIGRVLCTRRDGVEEAEARAYLRYKTDRRHGLQRRATATVPSLGQHTTMLYALERESDLGSTSAVFVELSERGDVSSGPVP